MWIDRDIRNKIIGLRETRPALILTGARQTGKTSLLKRLFNDVRYVSLDLPLHAEMAEENPQEFLNRFTPPVIVDEVQYAPQLFRYLKIAIDEDRDHYGRFILTGSQKFSLMKNISESLAGRIGIVECLPLSLSEIERAFGLVAEGEQLIEWILRGGYPEIYRVGIEPAVFFSDYVATYLERDVRQLIKVKDLRDFERFMRLLATRCGQLLSFNSLGATLGVSPNTVKSWISVLEASQIIHLVEPFYKNKGKRIKKTPKLYFHDTGLCCFLMGIATPQELKNSTLMGAVFENHVFSQIYKATANFGVLRQIYFYRDHQGREVDFILEQALQYDLVEVKWSENPKRSVPGFEAFEKLVGADNIKKKKIVTPTRGSMDLSSITICDSVDW